LRQIGFGSAPTDQPFSLTGEQLARWAKKTRCAAPVPRALPWTGRSAAASRRTRPAGRGTLRNRWSHGRTAAASRRRRAAQLPPTARRTRTAPLRSWRMPFSSTWHGSRPNRPLNTSSASPGPALGLADLVSSKSPRRRSGCRTRRLPWWRCLRRKGCSDCCARPP
jgi:hypothetical protein